MSARTGEETPEPGKGSGFESGPGGLGELFSGPWPLLARRAHAFARAGLSGFDGEPRNPQEEDEALRAAVASLAKASLTAFCVPTPWAGWGSDRESPSPAAVALTAETNGSGAWEPEGWSGLLREIASGPGEGPSARALCLLRETLAWHSGLVDLAFVMQGLGSYPIALAGSAEVRDRWLPAVARGKAIAAIGLTEPGAGSDLGGIALTARRSGGDYVLDGEKTFITNAPVADLICLFARTSDDGVRGLSAFAVPADHPGLDRSGRMEVIAAHPIGSLRFNAVRIPVAWRLGEEGEGARIALATLSRFRPTVGAAAVGLARRALDEATQRAKERVQFGRPLAEQQGIQAKLADAATHLAAARLLVAQAALKLDAGQKAVRESSMAKLFATETAAAVADEAVQIFGGLGVMKGTIVERIYREVRAMRIYEGTSEIQRTVIAKELLRDEP